MEKHYQIIKPKHGYYKGECLDAEIAPTIDTGVGCWHTLIGESKTEEVKCNQVGMLSGGKLDKLHDTNRRVYASDGLSPTLTTMGGGQREPKILEPLALDEQNGYIRQDGIVGTLVTDGSSPKHNNRVIEPNYRFLEQAFKTLQENDCEAGDTIDAFNKRVNKDGVSPTITTRPDGFKTAILPITQDYRIRKLTEKECGRLMGVKNEDCEKIAKNQSTSSQYHLYGDSIVTTCLMAIFGELFSVDYQDKINSLTEELRK